ncbi:putative disease resistance protein RGA3 isoform X3 [Phragmites australis]|uniref:putative disease resistance protein RGA3 isoform X3 n=1 Tax=Phragmites australis TaxID=29695 RepID=UPI002D76BE58|nr:putative disease resistance protein RGA3 isoform X3 [Phragmites australis]
MTMGMVVGEMLVSALLKVVVGQLGAVIGPEVSLLWKFKDDLESIRRTLATLQAVLNDAEKRSSREECARLWLKRLKSAAYDIQDMLWELEFMNGLKGTVQDTDHSVFRKVTQFRSHVTIAHKMKKMRQMLEKIKDEARLDIFNFKSESCSLDEDINSRATFSSVSEDIVGRAIEKETIVSMLTTYSEEEILTISVYGFGGLGKTTLVRLAFNDENVGGVFDYRVWVYVSMKFDLKKIAESIISEVEGSCICANLQEVTRRLQSVLAGKKFLVVLDDLWEENGCQLLKLKAMLNGGAKGSKIVITTRSEKIAALMHPSIPYKMDVLSDDDCWILFKQRAFVPGRDDHRIEEIGRDIVKKCKGVPLSAQALGFVMRFKEGVAAWEAVRDSEIWEMEEDQNIMPSLKLSYCSMPCHLRLCFAYCAVFSKGAVIDKDMLIQQWIALGLIQPASGSLTLEKRGEEYVRELVSMSFLQASISSLVGFIRCIEQNNGVLSTCQTAPSQDSSGDTKMPHLRIKRPVKVRVRQLKLRRRGVTSVPVNARTRNKTRDTSQQSRRDSNLESKVYVGDLIDFLMRMRHSSQEGQMTWHHRSMDLRAGVSQFNLF